MTNKEAIFKLIEYKRWLERNFEKFNAEPFDMAIGVLEKETVLDEIRAEIYDLSEWYMNHDMEDIAMVITTDVMAVIDKYRAEVRVRNDL